MFCSQLTQESRMQPRSMGLKLVVICGLALLMTIPSFFVSGLVEERTQRAAAVTQEISGHVGGPQTFLGPTLAIPYSIPAGSSSDTATYGVYLVFPAQASAAVRTTTEERHRSLFKVPVFQADLQFEASFDLKRLPAFAPPNFQFDWSRTEILVGVSDARGALADATLTTGAQTITMTPAELRESVRIGGSDREPVRLTLFGAKAAGIVKPETAFHVTSSLKFSGAQRIAVLAYGKTTHLKAQGDWRDPGFDGGILPVRQHLSERGFTADWSVPFLARGVRSEALIDSISGLDATAMGFSFIEVADAYQSINRSLKYVLLFLSLVFLSYFVFEMTTGKRIHPAQYVLVGIAQTIFYLLLLSIAERVGFDMGFLIAAASTVALLSANAGWILASRFQAQRAFVIFGTLYFLIYFLLRLEEIALLVGAITSFLAVAAVMYFTRGIDWYSSLPFSGAPTTPTPSSGDAA